MVEKCVVPAGLPVVLIFAGVCNRWTSVCMINILAAWLGTSVAVVKTAISA